MSTIQAIAEVIGGFVFLFVFWRRLKEDYDSFVIFSTQFFILVGFLVAYLTTKFVLKLPDVWFWADFVGFSAGLTLGLIRFKIRFYELLEASVIGSLYWLAIVFITYSLVNYSLPSLIASGVLILLVVVFYLLDARYKGFAWYKSGKIGFSGLATLGLFFLLRATSSLLVSNVLSFSGKFDSIASGILAFGSFLLLYKRSLQG